MKENVLKSFLRDTYQTSSPIPYIITGQVVMFVFIHIFDLLSFAEITDKHLFTSLVDRLSLPADIGTAIRQPWVLVTHPFIYQGIFNILFDCLWLYWIGNMFLNLLNSRQFWTVFGGGVLGGALLYLTAGLSGFLNQGIFWNTTVFGLAALISSVSILTPNMEVRLFLFGNVKLKTIAIVYLALQFIFIARGNSQAGVAFLAMVLYGIAFMMQLKKGNDWSKIWSLKKRRKLKVVHRKDSRTTSQHPGNPSQEEIDQILDKISQNGYSKLTSREKDLLFRASKQD